MSDLEERVLVNPEPFAAEPATRFDYIVCGAGTSGCVVAARLAADPKVKVLLLEAGGSDETDRVGNPSHWPLTLGSDLDWGFVAEPNPRLNGRAISYSVGKALGGGSSISAGTWFRGHRADWDFFASESGEASWGYEAVRDLYRGKIESWAGSPDLESRGSEGMIRVQSAARPHPFSFALLESAEAAGLRRFPSPNGRMLEEDGGCALVEETGPDGEKQSIFRSYLLPLMAQPNLTVLTGALVTRIRFERIRAAGIEFRYQGKLLNADATEEVILSLGAIQTPKLLMQSGIGDEEELDSVGIPVFQVLPGVGRDLHDHLSFSCIWENTDRAPPSARRSQTEIFWKSSDALDAPNFSAYAKQGPNVTPENAARFKPPAASWSLVVGMRPRSRGAVHLTGPEPTHPVRISANYLGESQDLRDLRDGLSMARDIGNSSVLRPFAGREVAPGFLRAPDRERFFRNGLGTFWHQSGTAKMGRDPMSVVDGKLRVYGVDRLRIADASVMPRASTGNPLAPCVVIGERAAEFLMPEAR